MVTFGTAWYATIRAVSGTSPSISSMPRAFSTKPPKRGGLDGAVRGGLKTSVLLGSSKAAETRGSFSRVSASRDSSGRPRTVSRTVRQSAPPRPRPAPARGFQRGRQRSLGGVVLQQAPAPPDARAPHHRGGADDRRSAVPPVSPVIRLAKADAGEERQRGEGAAGGVGAAGARHGSG